MSVKLHILKWYLPPGSDTGIFIKSLARAENN